MVWVEPLNLQMNLVNTLAGNSTIFIFLSLIVIAGMGAFFRMSGLTLAFMIGIFGMFMATIYQDIIVFAILLAGLLGYSIWKGLMSN